jgi:hypothetical protein
MFSKKVEGSDIMTIMRRMLLKGVVGGCDEKRVESSSEQ